MVPELEHSLTVKIEDGGVCKNWNLSVSPVLYEDICTKFCGNIHRGHTEIGLTTERPLAPISRSRRYLTLNISETVRDTCIVSVEY